MNQAISMIKEMSQSYQKYQEFLKTKPPKLHSVLRRFCLLTVEGGQLKLV
jgi:hypothetical protein